MATHIKSTTKTEGGSGGGSVKTTTYETTRSYHDEPVYKSKIGGRHLVINRGGGPSQTGMSMQKSVSYSMAGAPAFGAYTNVANVGVANVKTSRDREKKDMQDLNERFASYIERVRFLEAQNRKLADELDKLKSKWGKETTAIKAMYQAELDEARKLLDEAEKEKARLQVANASLELVYEELQEKLNDARRDLALSNEKLATQIETLSSYESEINLLQRRVETMEGDREKDKKEIARLTDALNRARVDLDNETLAHIDAENRRQTLEEELEFLKQVHEQEMKELAALAYRDTTNENREFWKSEMAQAMREIQGAYDEKLDTMRGELETYYNMKVQEFRTGAAKTNMETVHAKEETKRYRGQISDLKARLSDAEAKNHVLERELADLKREFEERSREWTVEKLDLEDNLARRMAELDAVLKELQDLMDSKLGLELEIAAYRKLLEGEENKVGLRQVVDQWVAGGNLDSSEDSSLKVSQVVKGEMSAKTTYQRSAKGPISISECSADGCNICLENTGRREEMIGGWKIQRTADGKDPIMITLPHDLSLKPGKKIKLATGGTAGPGDIDIPPHVAKNFGTGANVMTKLVNTTNEDRATHVQKTIYTS